MQESLGGTHSAVLTEISLALRSILSYYVVYDTSYTTYKRSWAMKLDLNQAVTLPWLALGAFWGITALGAKRALRTESGASRLYHLLFMTAVFALLFRQNLRIGQLGFRIIPASREIGYLGLALTYSGAAFALWARSTLGSNWSAMVSVKENHSFVELGPYRLVRHPIYAGLLLAMLGTALVYGEAGCFLAVILAFVGWWLKARMEEEFMIQQFGEQYRSYQRNVKQLIPFVL
ncbi:MAG TPA: isoprenylcysteine carboxylmethyltransferase family protein [Terriglobales bacterium]|nr:isoprenylcysteine carboxylmethyltransferase family protein [Terriglobales bacterium]